MEITDLIGVAAAQSPGTRPAPTGDDRFDRHLEVAFADPSRRAERAEYKARVTVSAEAVTPAGESEAADPASDAAAEPEAAPKRAEMVAQDSGDVAPAETATPGNEAQAAEAVARPHHANKPDHARAAHKAAAAAESTTAPAATLTAATPAPAVAVTDGTVVATPAALDETAAAATPAAPAAVIEQLLVEGAPVPVAPAATAPEAPVPATPHKGHGAHGKVAKAPGVPELPGLKAAEAEPADPALVLAAVTAAAPSVTQTAAAPTGGHVAPQGDRTAPLHGIPPTAGDVPRGTTAPVAPTAGQPQAAGPQAPVPGAQNQAGQNSTGQNPGGQNGGAAAQTINQLAAAASGETGGRAEFRLPDVQSAAPQNTAARPDLGTMGGSPLTQATSGTTGAPAAAAMMRPAPAMPQPAFQPPAIQVAMNIADAIEDGSSRIGIRLHPEELGRVDVRLSIGRDGRVSAMVLADRPDTLTLLRNDSHALERALADAGLHAETGGLSFGLRERGEGGFGRDQYPNGKQPGSLLNEATVTAAAGPAGGLNSRALDISV